MAQKLPRPDLSTLSEADKDKLIMALFDQVDALMEKVESLTAQVQQLQGQVQQLSAQLAKNSRNSSKPPSSDGLAKPKKTQSLRQASGKDAGGQPGHKGTTLKRMAPTEVVTHPLPPQCARCRAVLPADVAQVWERRQVIDIPAARHDVIEHRVLAATCQCGHHNTSLFPPQVGEPVQYGPRIRALGVHLTQGQMLPFARAAELIEDIHGVRVSPGTLVAWVGQARAALDGTADMIAAQLRLAPVVHADESGLRVAGKLHWLHVAANDTLTWYGVHEKRGMAAVVDHGILVGRTGVLVHDCLASYWQLDGSVHALCNAHLLRELLHVKETTGQPWADKMSKLLLQANTLCLAAQARQLVFDAGQIQAFHTLYDEILTEGEQLNPVQASTSGRRAKQSTATNLLKRLRRHAAAVLRFVADFSVPFTNNEAERAVRMPKVKQKISGCFRTLEGAGHFCVIRSCLDTLRKQGYSMLQVLERAFIGNPIQPTTLSS
jgi:transposase